MNRRGFFKTLVVGALGLTGVSAVAGWLRPSRRHRLDDIRSLTLRMMGHSQMDSVEVDREERGIQHGDIVDVFWKDERVYSGRVVHALRVLGEQSVRTRFTCKNLWYAGDAWNWYKARKWKDRSGNVTTYHGKFEHWTPEMVKRYGEAINQPFRLTDVNRNIWEVAQRTGTYSWRPNGS